jgi:hypothetical protein
VLQGLQALIPARSKMSSVLPLREEKAIIAAGNEDTKEVMERSHVSHSKLTLKGYNNILKKPS